MREIERKLISELLKNSRRSDRDLAKAIGSSQPTITRMRHKLEKEGYIKEYTMIPDFTKLGMKIMAFHFAHWKSGALETLSQKEVFQEKVADFFSGQPNMIFASSGQGWGMSRTGITFHKDYSDFVAYKTKMETDWGSYMTKYDTFIISLKGDKVMRSLTLKYLADYITSI